MCTALFKMIPVSTRHYLATLQAEFPPCSLLNSEPTSGTIGQAFIPTCQKVIWAGPLKNRSIGCSTGKVGGVGRNRDTVEPLD